MPKRFRKPAPAQKGAAPPPLPSRSIPLSLRFEVMKRDHFRCYYCGRRPPDVELEVDHIYPFSLGGPTILNNLSTTCFDCNRGKRNTPPVPVEWAPTYEDLAAWAYDATRAQYFGVPEHEIEATLDMPTSHEARLRLANLTFSQWIILRGAGKITTDGEYLHPQDAPF